MSGALGITRRFPIGPVAGISPFNFPLNLAAHKVAPAIAAGCSIVLKPPSRDPLTMLTVAEIIEPPACPRAPSRSCPCRASWVTASCPTSASSSSRFTGSPGRGLAHEGARRPKKVVLELGGNAGAIVDASADLDWAVRRLVVGAFAYAGQVCISVQRLLVHEPVWDAFMERFVAAAATLRMGDPMDPATDLGPMVDARAAARTERWVREAVAEGARVLLGGTADGRLVPARRSSSMRPSARRSARRRPSRRSSWRSRSATSRTPSRR